MRDLPSQRGEPRLRMLATVREFALELLLRESRGGGDQRVATPNGTDSSGHVARAAARRRDPARGARRRSPPSTRTSAPRCEHRSIRATRRRRLRSAPRSGGTGSCAVISRRVAPGSRACSTLPVPHGAATRRAPRRRDDRRRPPRAEHRRGRARRRGHFRAVLEIRQRSDDRAGVARALADLGWIALAAVRLPGGAPAVDECLALAEELGATRVAALALTNLGAAALFEGNFDEACAHARAQRGAARRRWPIGGESRSPTPCSRGRCAAPGRWTARSRCSKRAEDTLARVDDRRLIYFARDMRAEAFLRQGDAATRRRDPRDRLDLGLSSLRRPVERRAWPRARELGVTTARPDRAGRRVRRGESRLRRAEEDRYGEAECLALLAAAARANGDHDARVGAASARVATSGGYR